MYILKQFLIILISFFLTIVLFYLSAVAPAMVLAQMGNDNPPPPFDVSANGIYFSYPIYQIPVFIFLLLVPTLGSFMAYLLNGNKRNLTVLLPAIVGYLFYAFMLSRIYFHIF